METFPGGAQPTSSTRRIFFFFSEMPKPRKIRASIDIHTPGSSLPKSLSCPAQKIEDAAQGVSGRRTRGRLPVWGGDRHLRHQHVRWLCWAGDGGSPESDAFPPTCPGDGCRRPLVGRWSLSTVAPDEGGSEERFPGIVLFPPRRLRVHVASERT